MWPFKSEKLDFTEEALAPMTDLVVEFSGLDSFKIMPVASRLMRDVMKITTVQLREDVIRWDTTGENREFYGIFRGFRTEDQWTKSIMRIVVQGEMGKDRMGWVRIKIKGAIKTSVESPTPLHKWLWNIWNYTFYYKQRRAYIDALKDDILAVREKILEMYGIARGP